MIGFAHTGLVDEAEALPVVKGSTPESKQDEKSAGQWSTGGAEQQLFITVSLKLQ
ncbi:MAG: hypothetical protein IPJ43_19905 [Saprospiraceae bacterium]|nr:hypothetical protein [Saprospiraceae bacterium]